MRWIAHVDMDAFFCSVEVRENPALAGLPVIVGSDPQQGKGRGVVSAASYEARKFGVHSAMPISEAWRRCPQGVYIHPTHNLYSEVSDQVMDVLAHFTPHLEQISVDEAFLDLSGSERLFGPPEECGRAIKEAVKRETRLTCSVGMSAVKFVSKIASDLRKPDGLVIVPPGQEVPFLHPLPVEKLWGVGDKSHERLLAMGIRTVGDLATKSQREMSRAFGPASATHLLELAWGRDPRVVHGEDRGAKSVSHETTYMEDVTDPEVLLATIRQLSEQVSHRLVRHHWLARTVQLKYRTSDFKTLTRRRTLPAATQRSQVIVAVALELFHEAHEAGNEVRLIGVGTSGIEEEEVRQLDLFGAQGTSPVDKLVVEIEEKFGKGTIHRGSVKPKKHVYDG